MPNFKKHATVGGLLGSSIFVIYNIADQYNHQKSDAEYKFNWSDFFLTSLVGAGIGAICGILPDILEPATSPNHRKIFHSSATLLCVTIGLGHVQNNLNLDNHEKQVITTAGICYLSHLILDSNTPAGLPLLT